MYDWTADGVQSTLAEAFAPDAEVHLAFPFEDLDGAGGWWADALSKVEAAMPDVERRDTIIMGGDDPYGSAWVGACGYYTGTWINSFLDIPATGHQAVMRFHEFYEIVDGRVVQLQALWDIPELMMQSGVWPMGPTLGREWHVPGPATQDGLHREDRVESASTASKDIVVGMLGDMIKCPEDPDPAAMRLDHWWHPKFSWYGPSGIGTGRGVDGFRRHHQIPFHKAMPDRHGGYSGESHFFGDNNYVGVTAWPGMGMTMTGDGFLGIAPTDKAISMRSLDFWRVENGQIRENWVLVDLLSVWDQLGVDVFERMRELAGGPHRGH
jgi:predicted ester cyclase